MQAPPVTASKVPTHPIGGGRRRSTTAWITAARTGPLPIASAVPSATPVAFTPAKNARL